MKRSQLINRSLLKLSGTDTVDFLQNLVTNDLKKLSATQVVYSALLTPQGKFLHDFFVIEWNGCIYLDCLKERAADLQRRLTMYKLRADVIIEDVSDDFSIFALFGDEENNLPANAGEALAEGEYILYRDPRLSQLGARLLTPTSSPIPFESLEVSAEEYDIWRLSQGVPEGGTDIIPEKNFLLEVNFEELNGVSFSKGCYLGQELTARTKYRAKIKKKLFAFKFDGDISVNDAIRLNSKEIATVTAFTKPYGLALTRLADWQKLDESDTTLEPVGLELFKPDYVIIPEISE